MNMGPNAGRRTILLRLHVKSSEQATTEPQAVRGQAECIELKLRQRINGFATLRMFIDQILGTAPVSPRSDQKED
ncbi:hypothetical protein EU803_16005 [Loktanella sp. IMCC34160]|uniref:hypothetical protein n=1 Tax=Loktanella sp. IMCC34160 TaxID=2510646 RepID=UPI00101CA5DD|nr:hypothetical protein [Loktanella sp. IMCC34160]RYG89658.1 hypothetical protein EU803_16005 [Loktanella sp. IMCC34160]